MELFARMMLSSLGREGEAKDLVSSVHTSSEEEEMFH